MLYSGPLDPTRDGVTHVNVYSKGKTRIGRFLSNFAHTPFVCDDGAFDSVEGYWYWLKTKDESLRTVHGFEAKVLGKSLPLCEEQLEAEEFQSRIRAALDAKFKAYGKALIELRQINLPLAHYYVFGRSIKDAGYKWILEHIAARTWPEAPRQG